MDLLAGLEEFNRKEKPSNLSLVYYFFLERGITLVQLDELPLPYIFDVMSTHSWIVAQQEKEMDKAKAKG